MFFSFFLNNISWKFHHWFFLNYCLMNLLFVYGNGFFLIFLGAYTYKKILGWSSRKFESFYLWITMVYYNWVYFEEKLCWSPSNSILLMKILVGILHDGGVANVLFEVQFNIYQKTSLLFLTMETSLNFGREILEFYK